jgi:hypothetical protein
MIWFEYAVANHPVKTILFVGFILVAFFMGMKRLVSEDLGGDSRDYRPVNGKRTHRLD